MRNNSSPGQAVYEPFIGSGTTIIAARDCGRISHAIELTPAYVDVAVLRWQAFTGGEATLEATGQTFAEVAADRIPETACRSSAAARKTAAAKLRRRARVRSKPKPPDDMPPRQRRSGGRWSTASRGSFCDRRAQRDLLKDYCRHRATAEKIIRIINLFQDDWLKSKDGVKRYSELLQGSRRRGPRRR